MDRIKSEIISDFIKLTNECIQRYELAEKCVGEQDKLTTDLLHSLELEDTNYGERAKIATRLKTNRLDRRYYKDIKEEYAPLYEFLQDPVNKKAINKLVRVLGETRKAEKYHEQRTYKPRINMMEKEKND